MAFYPLDPETSAHWLRGSTGGRVKRGFIAVYSETPIAADTDYILNDRATSASAVTTVTTFLAQPDVPRVITVTPGGTTADVPAGDVTITGTDACGQTITDTITFAANASTAGTTVKAFKTITSIAFPIQDGAAATYDVGVGAALGIAHVLYTGSQAILKTLDATADTGSFTLNADVSRCVYTPSGTPDGTKRLRLWYLVSS